MLRRASDRWSVTAATALLVLAAAGCSPDQADGSATDGRDGSTGTGASQAYERVATDQLSVTSDGAEAIADCWNGICRWSTADGGLELVPDRGSVAVAPDGSTVAVLDDADVVLQDLVSGAVGVRLVGLADVEVADGSPVTAVAYSTGGDLIAGAGLGDDGSRRLLVWSVEGEQVASFATGGEVHSIAFSADGERVATTGTDSVEVHDLRSGASRRLESGEGGDVAWSADGELLVGPGATGQPVAWDTASWEVVAELPDHRLHEASFSPAGGVAALTALGETEVLLWDLAGDGAVRRLRGHAGEPGAVSWAPDGSVVYSVSADEGVLGWEASTGERTATTFEVPAGR